uniref:Uncharacterized protein n=1 Tax=Timema shepardi TaxID=629360 RepID=A0A7R9G3C9_TIMSH|nr:unnamed protein product [Timema shepardi]
MAQTSNSWTGGGFAEMVGTTLGLVLILWCSWRWLALGLILVAGGGVCLLCWFLPPEAPWNQDGVMLALGMVGRVAIASSLTMLQVGSPELFPPEMRRLGGVSCVTFGRMILLSAIFIVSLANYGKNVSLSTFGGITVIGGLATLYLGFPKNDSLSAQFKRKLQCVWSVENREKTNNNISSPNKLGADEIVERYTSILGDGNMIV